MLKVDRFIPQFNFKLTTTAKRNHKHLLVIGFFLVRGKKPSHCKLDLISKEKYAISLISEQKTFYVCLGEERTYNLQSLTLIANKLSALGEYDLDIDLATFVTKKFSQEQLITIFARTWYYLLQKHLHHKTDKSKAKYPHFSLLTDYRKAKQLLDNTSKIAQAVGFCRNLQNEAPNLLHSENFAQLIEENFRSDSRVECQVLNRQQIIQEKMNLLLAVNAGSQYEPRVVILKYFGNPSASKKVTVVLGKGITFDTGGYSLKPSDYQRGMKFDMSGAAITLSTIMAISALKLEVNVVAIACITDNALGSKATLVESVIRSKSGKTVEITNTDAEGRLILADGIAYALQHFQPHNIIELSTLTGAISITLGDWITGAFVNPYGEKLYNALNKAAHKVDERLWRLPVTAENTKMMKSSIADLVNASKDYKGASSNAAAFLFSFIDKRTPFVHFDIAGTATKPENLSGTGVMIRTLIQFFLDQSKDTANKERQN